MMTEVPSATDNRRRLSPARRVDAACDRFEAAWRSGQDPRIEDYLEAAAQAERPALLRALITLEVELRQGRGEHPAPGEYRDRFPGQSARVNAAFAETALGSGMSRPQSGRTGQADSRSLLFGLLALQNNFIDRDALLAALNSWAADRSRSLGQILLARGALSPSRNMLLEALVQEHILLHDDDPRKSLASLSWIGSIRDELSWVADPGVQDTLTHIPAARKDTDPDRTASLKSAGGSTSAGTRFRVLRPHAEGGLGQVHIALDTELNRDVALKEIQARFADDPRYRARFEFEAEITGGLEHPGIVPVYGLGHTPGGRPFYAMRFIKGNSLKEAIRQFHEAEKQSQRDSGQSTLELRELVGRFIDVCDAVAYAHSRRVLHRDIKPANILLGKYGETLVVDWGLAKALDQPEVDSPVEQSELPLKPASGSALEPTQAGSAVGSPAYMSPEQASGQLDLLGPWSDVYGLGATLYHLLTGRAPCEAEPVREVYREILAGEIPRPRLLNPRVAPGLEAICLKALALRPGNRYESAEALKADLKRWLADEPVSAWREPFSIRARRWAQRNRMAVTGAAAALVVGVMGLSAVAMVQSRSKSALQEKNRQLTEANAATTREKIKAETALAETTKARRETEAALAQKGAALAQSEESRQRAEAVLAFLKDGILAAARPESLDGGLGKDVTVRQAIDAAEPKIAGAFRDQPAVEADVRDTLGTTYWYLGEVSLAIRQCELALELRRTKLGPDHPDTLQSRCNLACDYASAGRVSEAIALDEVTFKLRELKLGPDHPATLETRNNLADEYRCAGRTADAIALQETTLQLMEVKLGPGHPNTLTARNNLAMFYQFAGRNDRAIAMLEETLKQQEAKLGPGHPGTLNTRNNLAGVYHVAGRNNRAIAMLEKTLKQQEAKLGPDHPGTLTTRNNLARVYSRSGHYRDAVLLHAENLKLREAKLGDDDPATLQSRSDLAVATGKLGFTGRSVTLLEPTLKAQQSKLGPDHPDTAYSRDQLAIAYESLGRWADAESLWRDALVRRRNAEKPESPRLADHLARLGSNLQEQSKWSEAEPVLRECLAIRAKMIPDDWSHYDAMSLLGGALLGQGRFAEAEPLSVAGYEGMKAREARIDMPNRFRLSDAAERVVQLYEAWGKPDHAATWKTKLGMPDLPADVFARP
jgi:eukaryotic-like serine/threonine-protein kinase